MAEIYDGMTAQEKAKDLISSYHRGQVEKMRHIQEIAARYEQGRQQYQKLLHEQRDNREQRVMLYAELKTLGWCMGRDEKRVIKEINDPKA